MPPLSSVISRSRFSDPRAAGFRHFGAAAAALVATVGTFRFLRSSPAEEDGTATSVSDGGVPRGSSSDCRSEAGGNAERAFTPSEVAERNGVSRPELYVSYHGNVYDVTDFARSHPGGESFLRSAAGGPLEPYWAYWAYHTKLGDAKEERPTRLLEELRIGTLASDDDDDDEESDDDDGGDGDGGGAEERRLEDEMYASDPHRKGGEFRLQLPLVGRPYCSETSPEGLRSYLTDVGAFYVRNHAPVPDLDWVNHDVTFECDDDADDKDLAAKLRGDDAGTETKLDLDELRRRYSAVVVPSVLQCAGNRASEMMTIAPTSFLGTPFETIKTGMIGNALWSGVRLRQVLLDVFPGLSSLTPKEIDGLHVEFEGVDEYRASVPLNRVLDESNDVLLAFEMNGEPLRPDHGYPVRAFLPGVAGARSVKWLHAVRLRSSECDSTWNKTYYLDPNGNAIQTMPIQSFLTSKRIVEGKEGSAMKTAKATGVAWGGGGGRGVDRVQVSIDGGKSWIDADIKDPPESVREAGDDDSNRRWSWVQFEAAVALPPRETAALENGAGTTTMPKFACRAFDSDGKTQPAKWWYPKGYLYNGWHEL